jgi:hypothetical protein
MRIFTFLTVVLAMACTVQSIAGQQSLSITANLCDAVEFNADIVVYEGTCQGMTQIACNGHYPNDGWEQCYLGSRVDTQVTAGTMYLIRVGFDGLAYPHEDNGTLTINCLP